MKVALMPMGTAVERMPLWEDVPADVRAEVRQAAIVELSLKWRVACDRLSRFEKRVAARAHHLQAYRQEHQRLTDRVNRLNRALDAEQRLR